MTKQTAIANSRRTHVTLLHTDAPLLYNTLDLVAATGKSSGICDISMKRHGIPYVVLYRMKASKTGLVCHSCMAFNA